MHTFHLLFQTCSMKLIAGMCVQVLTLVCVCVLIKCVSRGRLLSPPTCLKSSKGVNVTLGLLTGSQPTQNNELISPHSCSRTQTHKQHSYSERCMLRCLKKQHSLQYANVLFNFIFYSWLFWVEAECQWGETGGVDLCSSHVTVE